MARCGCPDPDDVPCGCAFDSVNDNIVVSSGVSSDFSISPVGNGVWLTLGTTYFNNFSPYAGSTYNVPQARRIFDCVYLRGRILKSDAPAVAQQILSGMSTSFRPSDRVQLACPVLTSPAGDNSYIEVRDDGTMYCQSTRGGTWLQLDGLKYTV